MTSPMPLDPTVEREVRQLYRRLIEAWNKRNARDFALLFTAEGNIVGFDGSQVFGQVEIGAHVSEVFTHHQTARYVTVVRGVRAITADTALLTAVVGMAEPDKNDINPDLNAVQTLVAVNNDGWRIALFQNTPAALHGRPDDVKKLTEELRSTLRSESGAKA